MHRVDAQPVAAERARKHAVRGERHVVGVGEHAVEIGALGRMVRRGLSGPDVAPQRAAEGDVQLLKAAADAEHGLALRQHGVGEAEGELVAIGVERSLAVGSGFAIA